LLATRRILSEGHTNDARVMRWPMALMEARAAAEARRTLKSGY
jgi:hypothetical protein